MIVRDPESAFSQNTQKTSKKTKGKKPTKIIKIEKSLPSEDEIIEEVLSSMSELSSNKSIEWAK